MGLAETVPVGGAPGEGDPVATKVGAGVAAGVPPGPGPSVGTGEAVGVGAGLGYLLGNELDKRRAREQSAAEPTELTGTKWHVEQLNMPNPPAYRDMYLSFEPNSQLVTTTITSDGRVLRAVETYRVADNTLIINRETVGDQPGYIINADFKKTETGMTVSSPQFSATLRPVNEIPAHA